MLQLINKIKKKKVGKYKIISSFLLIITRNLPSDRAEKKMATKVELPRVGMFDKMGDEEAPTLTELEKIILKENPTTPQRAIIPEPTEIKKDVSLTWKQALFVAAKPKKNVTQLKKDLLFSKKDFLETVNKSGELKSDGVFFVMHKPNHRLRNRCWLFFMVLVVCVAIFFSQIIEEKLVGEKVGEIMNYLKPYIC